jgi:riboflavin kinase/FMN adenylyltransferase
MKILSEAGLPGMAQGPVCLAIGVFDGVHLGHRAVIRQTLSEARRRGGAAVAITFDRHPAAIVAPDRKPPLLCPVWRKLEALAQLGLDATVVYAFDESFSRQSAAQFVDRLRTGFGVLGSVTVGASFVFGHGRTGNLDELGRLGACHGFEVHGLPPVEISGEVVSSTRLRELVANGEFDRAATLLGRRHTLAGEVIQGDRLGRKLGFPTANVDVDGLVLPPQGVYAGYAMWEGCRIPAAVNIGRRPTLDGSISAIRVEAHLPGFEGDLYGRRMELDLHTRLRPEQKFPSLEALVEQIGRDVAAVRVWSGN